MRFLADESCDFAVVEALRAAGGNRTEAARKLGISRVTLHDKLHKHGLARGGDE